MPTWHEQRAEIEATPRRRRCTSISRTSAPAKPPPANATRLGAPRRCPARAPAASRPAARSASLRPPCPARRAPAGAPPSRPPGKLAGHRLKGAEHESLVTHIIQYYYIDMCHTVYNVLVYHIYIYPIHPCILWLLLAESCVSSCFSSSLKSSCQWLNGLKVLCFGKRRKPCSQGLNRQS